MREKIINAVLENKIIVIVRNLQKDKLIPFAEAAYEGGIRLLEITYCADGHISDRETAENISMLKTHFDGRMYIGAGTVLNEKQVELTKEAGGGFIISPDVSQEVIKKSRELGLVSMPGAVTPSEMRTAQRAGADFVKLFPASNLGAEYVKAIKAPLSDINILAVGGINEKNIPEYLKAGVCGFGIGSNIVNKKMIEDGDFKGIKELAAGYVNAVKRLEDGI